MNKIQTKVLNKLLDKYESSKTFQGENKHSQRFLFDIEESYPKYMDDAEYDYFMEINEALLELVEKGLISITKQRNGVIYQVALSVDSLENCYHCVSRRPRREENQWLEDILSKYAEVNEKIDPLKKYAVIQIARLKQNKQPEYYDGDRVRYTDILKMTETVLQNEEELFIRDFSIRLFKDSKRAEQLESKVSSLLYTYGDYEEQETVLEESGIVKTPTYIMIKGNAELSICGQVLDLSKLNGDISLSTQTLKGLDYVNVTGKRVITIENLTSFHDYSNKYDCVIYLGGFHNKTKRRFICYLYEQNKDKEYLHFGDIDAGGFYILEHLKRKTGISFQSLYMNVETLVSNIDSTKKLTNQDKKRLCKLLEELIKKRETGLLQENYIAVIEFMLANECKLEQEAIQIFDCLCSH